ncbi:putative NAD(P)H quinone oxidoreductase, PIG3 family [Colwellia chukchiensis]|uniref:Putative NAD(P)H quinone oxidoreductase, PIG3 family n=1 Tax=Colwellia chukchiensis TaxID=641665 RepID=A0A1H7KKX4_9GAMM|nr:NAD(P)H-quinone oxidoreductase [Colwellia chukchiensis]SEK87170.1 putative NAD(P)H quinone oxidoreductase, PIG3 family [Colwellia chukchiensis]
MRYFAINDQQQLQLVETSTPEIANDECLIQVKAIGVNRADILQKQGKYPPPPGESTILGIEVCGDIVAIGQGESTSHNGLTLGDSVMAIVPGGAYAEFVKVKIAHVIKKPDHFSYAEGAAIAEAFLTAYQCLFTIADLQANSKVLIHAGASGVGTAAIQLAKQRGCHVSVTVGSDEKVAACKALGADEAINYQDTDFALWAKQHKYHYDVILDVVAGDYVNKNISVCALDGHIVILSMLAGRFADNIDVARMLAKRINIHATTLRSRSDDYKAKLIKAFNRDFKAALEQGHIKPVIYQQFPWQDVEQAHQVMENNANTGKLILIVD